MPCVFSGKSRLFPQDSIKAKSLPQTIRNIGEWRCQLAGLGMVCCSAGGGWLYPVAFATAEENNDIGINHLDA